MTTQTPLKSKPMDPTSHEAIECFKERKYAEAVELLGACLVAMPGDKPTAHYMDLCRQGLSIPPGQDPVPTPLRRKGRRPHRTSLGIFR